MPQLLAQLGTFVVALAGIAAATVAVCLGKIDAQSFTAIISGVLGIGLGAGIHAQGVTSITSNGIRPKDGV